MESVIAAVVSGAVTLIGVLIANSKSQAVTGTKLEDLTLTFPAGTADSWLYIEDTAIAADRGVLWPANVSTEAGSGTGVKDGFYNAPRTSGVCAGWCCGDLFYWGFAGLAARPSNAGAPSRSWAGCAGSPGLSG